MEPSRGAARAAAAPEGVTVVPAVAVETGREGVRAGGSPVTRRAMVAPRAWPVAPASSLGAVRNRKTPLAQRQDVRAIHSVGVWDL